jgi:hypothetical protein
MTDSERSALYDGIPECDCLVPWCDHIVTWCREHDRVVAEQLTREQEARAIRAEAIDALFAAWWNR